MDHLWKNMFEMSITGKKVDQHLDEPFKMRLHHRQFHLRFPKDAGGMNLKQSSSVTARLSCTPFNRLKRTNINHLLINVQANGFYLLLRTIEKPFQSTAIQTVVEDHIGNVIDLAVYNFDDPELKLCINDVLPLGAVLILKEPFAKTTVSGSIWLRCDCPSDIIIIDRSHKLYKNICNIDWINDLCEDISIVEPTSGEAWKSRGNELYGQKMYTSALEAYLVALNYSNSQETTVLINVNLAATYLALGYFESCLKYAQTVLETQPQNSKALFRAAKACCHLRSFEDAKIYFQKFLSLSKRNLEAVVEASRWVRRIQDVSTSGIVIELIMEALEKSKTHLDYPDFQGPIEIAYIEAECCGVIAKRDIAAGEVLVVSKAFGAVFAEPSEFSVEFHNSNKVTMGDSNSSRVCIIQTVLKNPNTIGKLVYGLPSGDPNVDKNGKAFCDESNSEPIADAERIRMIMATHSFRIKSVSLEMTRDPAIVNDGCGLFIFPSYFNHSCIPNTFWTVYNNVFVMHALQAIRCGDEVTMSFTTTSPSFLQRESLHSNRNFQCHCVLCDLDRRLSPPAVSKIESLIARNGKLDKVFDMSPEPVIPRSDLKKVKDVIREVSIIYKNEGRHQLKVALFRMYARLAYAYSKRGNLFETLNAIEKCFESVGLKVRDLLEKARKGDPNIFPPGTGGTLSPEVIRRVVILGIVTYNTCKRPEEVNEWFQLLLHLERICFGGSVETVQARYKEVPQHLFLK